MPFDKSQDEIQELGYLLAEASKNVVFVVGAGLSVPAGIPLWRDLNNSLMEVALEKISQETNSQEEKDAKYRQLQSLQDPWIIGDELARIIPRDRYVQLIREKLSADSVPTSYKLIWKLAPSGVVSFNLDSLAERAMRGASDQVASALEPERYSRFLLLSRPFLFQPHGRLSSPESWVLGASARNKLLRSHDSRYKRFISSLFASRRIVIAGFGPSDFAFESLLLEDFRGSMAEGFGHFWITPQVSAETRRWAKLYNLNLIEYEPSTAGHDELNDILRHLGSFRPRTPQAVLAYEGPTISYADLPNDDDLRSESVESIRAKLNAALKGGSEEANLSPEQTTEFVRKFYREYSGSVHMSWHVMPDSQYARVWGCKIIEGIGNGAFSNVWKVVDPVDGSVMALKVLREETLEDPYFLEAFRRGVSAMKILAQHGVPGMVKFISAYDIPACVFMEYIEGHTLFKAISSRMINDLGDILSVMVKVSHIVLSAHQLKERVLHRDLKPTNVMIPATYGLEDEMDVMVLDFDLSWYEGAMGKSMTTGALHNYAAPEQLVKHPVYSSRHTAVDVFGLGMLLYFSCAGEDPKLNAQNIEGFAEKTAVLVRTRWPRVPIAVIEALVGVIVEATKDAQPERISLPAFIERVHLLRESLVSDSVPIPSDLALLEAAAGFDSSLWPRERADDGRLVLKSTTSGATASIYFTSETLSPQLGLELSYADDGHSKRGNVGKFLKKKVDKACSQLSRRGLFFVRNTSVSGGSARIEAILHEGDGSRSLFAEAAKAISDAASTLAFEES